MAHINDDSAAGRAGAVGVSHGAGNGDWAAWGRRVGRHGLGDGGGGRADSDGCGRRCGGSNGVARGRVVGGSDGVESRARCREGAREGSVRVDWHARKHRVAVHLQAMHCLSTTSCTIADSYSLLLDLLRILAQSVL